MKIVWSILLILSVTNALAGTWPPGKGKGYIKLAAWWVNFDTYYDFQGNHTSLERTRSIGNISIYSEYGITDKFTGIVYFPFFSKSTIFELKNANTGDIIKEGEALSSVGDINIGLTYNILKKPRTIFNINLTLGVPLGRDHGGSDGSLQTGDGEFNQLLRFELARSISVHDLHPYFQAYSAFNNRSSGFSDEVQYGVEVGISMSVFTFITRCYGVTSLKNGNASEDLFINVPAANNTQYLNLAPELNVNFTKRVGVSLSCIKVLTGQNYFTKTAYTLGLFSKF